jgi:hypothetical protein
MVPAVLPTMGQLRQRHRYVRIQFPHDSRDLNDATNVNIAVASNPFVHPESPNSTPEATFEQEPDEPRIRDFDGSASEFWKLFRDEAKSHDDAQISTLKEGMDSALIFVRSYSIRTPIIDLPMLTNGPTGWFIFCCSHSIRSR